jgi:hypothetical protein
MGMNRPMYENEASLTNEAYLKQFIQDYTKSNLEKLPIKYGADFISFREGSLRSFIEAKCRTTPMGQYPTYMLSLHKVVTALSYSDSRGVPFVLFVKWTDYIGHVTIDRILLAIAEIKMGTNGTRDDAGDYEPCIYIPISSFKIVKKINL